jgi:hypothetical protein
MHRTFVFPIMCESPHTGFNSVEIREIDGQLMIVGLDFEVEDAYDAFNELEIIPSLINMVEKIHNGDDKLKQIKRWVKKWGVLEGTPISGRIEDGFGQSVSSFWEEAEKFFNLWNLYKYTVNRDLESIRNIVRIEKISHDDPDNIFGECTHRFFFFEGTDYSNNFLGVIRDEKNPLKGYQYACMEYLLWEIEKYVSRGELGWYSLTREPHQDKDYFKIAPALRFNTLLEAIYMQFFILLTENQKKICPICNHPFIPERKDKKYCSETCYLTAKSRRYRARKNAAI